MTLVVQNQEEDLFNRTDGSDELTEAAQWRDTKKVRLQRSLSQSLLSFEGDDEPLLVQLHCFA